MIVVGKEFIGCECLLMVDVVFLYEYLLLFLSGYIFNVVVVVGIIVYLILL